MEPTMLKLQHSRLSKKDSKKIDLFISGISDDYREFFITQNNIRLYIQDNKEILSKSVEKGDYLVYDTEEKGILLVTGYSDNFKRKYIKILAENNEIIYNLLKMLIMNVKEELFIKVNKRNPIIKILREFGFVFQGGRGKDILFCRKGIIMKQILMKRSK